MTVTANKMPRKSRLKVAQAIEAAITSMIKPISSGSLIGVLKRTIESAPSKPNESGSENWIQIKIAVIEIPNNGNARWI